MEKVTRLKIAPVTLLVLLALLTLLVAKRHKEHPIEEAEEDAVRTVVKLEDVVVHDGHAAVAFVALIALFAFVMWTAVGANKGEDTAIFGEKRWGRVSLLAAILGIALPPIIFVIGFRLVPHGFRVVAPEEWMLLAFCVLVAISFEFAALGCGIIGRRTLSGKAGLAISGLLISAAVLVIVLMFRHGLIRLGKGYD
jgi:hypothetical protein